MPTQSKLAIGLSSLIAIAIAFLTLTLTLTPASAPPLGPIAQSDKVYHVVAFAVLALPIAFLRPGWLILTVPVYMAFGGLIEIVQPFVGRDRSLADWIADLIGLGIGVAVGRTVAHVVPLAGPFSGPVEPSEKQHKGSRHVS